MTRPGPSESFGTSHPAPAASRPAPVARPSEVRTSARLWVAAVVLHLASLLAVYIAAASITSGASTRTRVVGLNTPHVVFVFVTAAIGLALAIVMRRGRNWARITLTVLGALTVVGTVVGLVFLATVPVPRGIVVTAGGPVGIAIDIAQTVCIVAAIVLFFRAPANAYFAAGRR